MSEPLKPQFFILRQNGSVVPLIAMDELPHNIRVEGVPRTMEFRNTVGMVNFGEYPSRHRHHQVQDTNKSSEIYQQQPLPPMSVQDARFTGQSQSSPPIQLPIQVVSAPKKAYGIVEQPPSSDESGNLSTIKTSSTDITDAFVEFEPLPQWKDTSNLGLRDLVPGRKVYCSHWMSTGECDYAQQGCKYKHEMPLDKKILNILGFQDIPKWYREQHGLGRLTAIPGSGAAIAGPNLQSNAMATTAWRESAGDVAGISRSPRPQTTTSDRGSPRATTKPWRGSNRRLREPQQHHTQNPSLIDSDRSEQSSRPRTITDGRTNTSQPPNQLLHSKFAIPKPSPVQATIPYPEHLRVPPITKLTKPRLSSTKPGSVMVSAFNTTTTTTQSGSESESLPSQDLNRTRSSSLFSDVETELIRANELRRSNEDAEYAETVAKARKEAELKNSEDEKETDE